MSEFAPPAGPPPPHVPEGWKAIYNNQYSEWFYVNLHTKESTWEKPTAPAPNPNSGDPTPPNVPPPSYSAGNNAPVNAGSDRKSPLPPSDASSNNPYHQNAAESDAEMARRLQAEEDTRSHGQRPGSAGYGDTTRGASDSYYNQSNNLNAYPSSPSYNNSSLDPSSAQRPGTTPEKSRSGSFLSKIKDKVSASASSGNNPALGRPMMGYNAGGYPPQQQRASGAPFYGPPPPIQQGYGGGPGYGPPMGGGYGGGGFMGQHQQPMYVQQKKKSGFGKGAALGVGGGLLGGALLMNGIDDMQDDAYDQGYDDGGGFDGGDFGGGDF